MKSRLWAALFVFFFAFVFANPTLAQESPPATEVDGKINWVFDLAEGQKISKEFDKPIFVVFRCER